MVGTEQILPPAALIPPRLQLIEEQKNKILHTIQDEVSPLSPEERVTALSLALKDAGINHFVQQVLNSSKKASAAASIENDNQLLFKKNR